MWGSRLQWRGEEEEGGRRKKTAQVPEDQDLEEMNSKWKKKNFKLKKRRPRAPDPSFCWSHHASWAAQGPRGMCFCFFVLGEFVMIIKTHGLENSAIFEGFSHIHTSLPALKENKMVEGWRWLFDWSGFGGLSLLGKNTPPKTT